MIRKRAGKYSVTVYDRSKSGGKRWVGTFASQKEAAKAEAQAKLNAYQRHSEETTCGDFAERWTTDYPRGRQSTNDHNAERVAAFAAEFKNVPLSDITRKAARRWSLDNPHRYSAVRAMFTDAVRDGYCEHNPFTNMGLPQSKGRKNIVVPPIQAAHKLAEIAKTKRGDNFAAFILTAAYTGMRPGELYALEWPAVDLENDEIYVGHSLSRTGELTLPKIDKTRRVVLSPEARDALGAVRREDGPVFWTHTGKRLTHTTISYQLEAVRNAAGFPKLSVYWFRHMCATHMLNVLGLPAVWIAKQLGHEDAQLVQQLYGHPDADVARAAIKRAYENVVDLGSRRETA